MTAPQTVADVLDAAADLLEKPGAWTQKANARDADGNKVPVTGGKATCFCMAGAILHLTNGDYHSAEYVRRVLPMPDEEWRDWLVAFNDAPGRTQSEVVAALRAAATSARQGETR
jgi:hypothetical protein